MSEISEQVKHLKELSDTAKANAYSFKALSQSLREAADTIESLSAKLDAANKEIEDLNAIKEVAEEIAENMKWIPCKDRLPEEHESIFKKFKGTKKWKDAMFEKTSNDVEVTVEFEDGTRKTITAHTLDGKWKVDTFVKNKVIAWRPFSEPYKENLNEQG